MPDALEIVCAAYRCFAAGDLPAVLACMDPGIVWIEAAGFPSVGGRHVGHEAVVAVLARVTTEWDGLQVIPHEMLADADRVVVLGETLGRHRLTGRTFRSPFAHAWRLRNSLIVEWQAYIDTALAQQAATSTPDR